MRSQAVRLTRISPFLVATMLAAALAPWPIAAADAQATPRVEPGTFVPVVESGEHVLDVSLDAFEITPQVADTSGFEQSPWTDGWVYLSFQVTYRALVEELGPEYHERDWVVLADGEELTYVAPSWLGPQPRLELFDDIEAGGSFTGWVVYEVPPDADLRIRFERFGQDPLFEVVVASSKGGHASSPEPTPTPSPTPVPTPSPVPATPPPGFEDMTVVLHDDFSDPGSGWVISDGLELQAGYQDGGYRLASSVPGKGATSFRVLPGAHRALHVEVDAKVSSAIGTAGFTGILCGPTQNSLYALLVDTTGGYLIVRTHPWPEPLSVLASGREPNAATNALGSVRLAADCNPRPGDTPAVDLALYVDDVLVGSATDESPESAVLTTIGLYTEPATPDFAVTFDDALVLAPARAAAAPPESPIDLLPTELLGMPLERSEFTREQIASNPGLTAFLASMDRTPDEVAIAGATNDDPTNRIFITLYRIPGVGATELLDAFAVARPMRHEQATVAGRPVTVFHPEHDHPSYLFAVDGLLVDVATSDPALAEAAIEALGEAGI